MKTYTNEEIALLATYYETDYDLESAVKQAIINNIILDKLGIMDDEDIISDYNEYNDEYYYELNDDNINLVFQNCDPCEIVNAVYNGSFSWNNDYFKFDEYENIQTYTSRELAYEILDDKDYLEYIYDYVFDFYEYDLDYDEIEEELERLLKAGY